jgi:hypothetical protein
MIQSLVEWGKDNALTPILQIMTASNLMKTMIFHGFEF